MVTLRSGGITDTLTDNPEIDSISTTVTHQVVMAEMIPAPDQPQPEVTNAQLDNSLQNKMALVTTNNESMATMQNDVHEIKNDITHIKDVTNESEAIKEQLYSTQGKVARLESRNQHLEEKLISVESKLLEKDLMFYNIRDSADETYIALKRTVYHIMRDDIKIPLAELFSIHNFGGEIRVDTATIIGKY